MAWQNPGDDHIAPQSRRGKQATTIRSGKDSQEAIELYIQSTEFGESVYQFVRRIEDNFLSELCQLTRKKGQSFVP